MITPSFTFPATEDSILNELKEQFKNYSASKKEFDHPGVYVGRYELEDIETGVIAKGYTKIGRTINLPALLRGRNQGGGNFVIYYYLPYQNDRELEKELIDRV
tara:strand:- start:3868 stop:4176 length:309 start_codon:yes stop_codon:yes gene_type:complete